MIVHGRRSEPAAAQAERIKRAGGHAEVLLGDLTVAGQPELLCAAALADGPVDVLVANAGPFVEHRFTEATREDWIAAFAGNVLSAVGCARALIPAMRRRGWGRIITIGTRGVATPLNMVEYSAAKPRWSTPPAPWPANWRAAASPPTSYSPGVILTSGLREMFEERARSAGDGQLAESSAGRPAQPGLMWCSAAASRFYLERGGRALQTLVAEDDQRLPPALAALVDEVRRRRIKRLVLERVNGEPALASSLGPALIAHGFQEGPRRLTLSA